MSGPAHASAPECRVGVVVPAAGSGQRMGGVRKPFLELAGEAVLIHALRPLLREPRVVVVVVALDPSTAADPPPWIAALDPRIRIVQGGGTRSESVRRALAALPEGLDVLVVHDAARPLATEEVVRRCIDLACEGVGAVAGCPASDTLKRVGAAGTVVETPDRASLWHAQTPQAFPAPMLRRAYADVDAEGTDDAALVERTGGRVRMVDSGTANLKVTRPEDVVVAEAILTARMAGAGREQG